MRRSYPHKYVTLDDIQYSLNEKEKTARIKSCRSNATEITIPRLIKYELKECIVTSISGQAFQCSNARSVTFEPNSELRTIEQFAFSCSNLTSISIPASVVELKDGWCNGTDKLSQIEVEAGNCRYLSVGKEFIIGKSNITNEDYDILVFWSRDSIEAKIPETIKIIGEDAFSESKLTSILIPANVTQICECAFYDCQKLARVEFEPNSELRTIKPFAFCGTNVTSILIPAKTVELKDGWCIGVNNLNHVEVEVGNESYLSVGGKYIIGKSDITNENYDKLIFWARDSVEVNIPETIKTIGAHAFSNSKLVSITIPENVNKICEHAFICCRKLSQIEFEPNSKLQTIEKNAFAHSKLTGIKIPAHVTQIHKEAFSYCEHLQIVEIEEDSADVSIYINVFNNYTIFMLPAQKKSNFV